MMPSVENTSKSAIFSESSDGITMKFPILPNPDMNVLIISDTGIIPKPSGSDSQHRDSIETEIASYDAAMRHHFRDIIDMNTRNVRHSLPPIFTSRNFSFDCAPQNDGICIRIFLSITTFSMRLSLQDTLQRQTLDSLLLSEDGCLLIILSNDCSSEHPSHHHHNKRLDFFRFSL